MATNFRTLFQWLLPRWINDGADGSRVVHALAWMIDASVERAYQGLIQRFPTYAGKSALALIGRDRQIPRGRNEPDASYAARLIQWRGLDGHKTRGNARALLRQIRAYFGGVACWTIDRGGNRDALDTDGVWSYELGYPWTWDTRPLVNDWARFWVVVTPIVTFDWFDKLAIWRLLYSDHPWRPGGTQPEWLMFAPAGYTPVPEATWGRWSLVADDIQTFARDPLCRYWSLAPWYNNTYGGDPTIFAIEIMGADATLHIGDPTSFPATSELIDEGAIALPVSGRYVTGNPASFPTSVQLPDDGDLQ